MTSWNQFSTMYVISKEKIYQELGLQSLQHRRGSGKLCLFYNILKNLTFKMLY